MKKFIVIAMAVLLLGFAGNVRAEGDFEMSGHINTGFGYQYNGKALMSGLGGAFVMEGMIPADATGYTGVAGATNKLTNNSSVLGYVGDVELDIAKTFGENIRLRTDIDFGRLNSNSYGFAIANMIEQAYVTVNIPVGYGLEFLVGRFNAPLGFEAVDNNDNDLPFHTRIFAQLRPQNLTGLKFYYPFSDLVDLHFWIANNLRDVQRGGVSGDGALPAAGLRLGFSWGMEGQENTLGVSGAIGSESAQAAARPKGRKWGDMSWFSDLDFNIWATDVFAIGGEGFIRRDGAAKGAKSNYYFAGLLNLHYLFSDVWDGTLRYSYVNDVEGSAANFGALAGTGRATLNAAAATSQYKTTAAAASATGADAQYHTLDLGVNYHITDGAKIMTMYRFDMIMPDKLGAAATYAAGTKKGYAHTIAANFAYEF